MTKRELLAWKAFSIRQALNELEEDVMVQNSQYVYVARPFTED